MDTTTNLTTGSSDGGGGGGGDHHHETTRSSSTTNSTPITPLVVIAPPPTSSSSQSHQSSSQSSSQLLQQSQSPEVILDAVIVGGGLCGIYVASKLQQQQQQQRRGFNFILLEASAVLGGRLANNNNHQINESDNDAAANNNSAIDMGGAWIWPHQQPNMRDLVQGLVGFVSTFPQPGDLSSRRFKGGAVSLVRELAKGIDDDRIVLNSPVSACTLVQSPDGGRAVVQVSTAGDGKTYLAKKVVLAVPPKIILETITFDPPLSETKRNAMKVCHTWMAGVTKVALTYRSKFWDDQDCSGSEIVNMGFPPPNNIINGPAFQVYDSSTPGGEDGINALTFFALVKPDDDGSNNANNNNDDDSSLAKQCANQLSERYKYYGLSHDLVEKVLQYHQYYVKRWPLEKYISENEQPTKINPHPKPLPILSQPEWENDSLLFAGSETDLHSPGMMEGAIGAAKRVLQQLQ